MALEYGINFNTEDGRKKAEAEIKRWRNEMQQYFDKNPINIALGGNGGQSSDVSKSVLQVKNYGGALNDLRVDYEKLAKAEKTFSSDNTLIEKIKNARNQTNEYGGSLNQAASANDKIKASQDNTVSSVDRQTRALKRQSDVLVQLKTYAMNFLSVYAGIRLIKNLAKITGEFEMQRISMQAILRDAEKGAAIFEQIKGLAVMSPYQFKDLVSYTKQLSAFSVPYEELYETTKRLADVSAGLGVDMSRLILAYGQVRSAAVLRGQELRQFTEAGIPIVEELRKKLSEANGELITTGEVFEYISARKVPFEMVRDVLFEMSDAGGKFYKMQEIQAETLKGKIANLTDAYQIMLSNIGESDGGIMKGVVDTTRALIENYETVGRVLISLITTYGAYKAAVISVNTAELFMNGTYVAKIRLLRTVVAAQKLLNKTMLANPYVLAATAIVGLTTALWAFRDSSTAAEKAQKRFNERLAETEELAEKEREKITKLITAIKDETKTRRERQLKLHELQQMYPQIFANLDLETAKYIELSEAIHSVNEEIDKRTDIQDTERVVEITKELVRLRAEHGTTAYAGMYKYEIDNTKRIADLEHERALLIEKSRKNAEAAVKASVVLADWQKSVDDFIKSNKDAEFLKYSDDEGTVYSYVNRIKREYVELTDKYEIYSKLVDEGSKKQAANYKRQINLAEQLASAMGFSLKESGGGGGKDPNIEQNAMIKASERLSELRAKMALEEKKYALEIRQIYIDAMEDGTEKELAQIQLTKEKDIQAIEERRQAMINANRDIARAKWESEGGKGTFSEEVKLSDSQNAELIAMNVAANMKEERSKELMLENLLEQYKDYAQKVEDIERKKNEAIKNLNAGRTSDNSEIIDRAIEEVKKKAKEETAALAFDEMKNSDAWRVLFSDLENYTVKTLKESLAVVEKTDISNLNPADAKAVQRALDKMKRKIDEKDPFFALINGWEQFIKATESNQPDAAEEALNRITKSVDELLDYFEEFQGLIGSIFGEDSETSFWTNITGGILGATASTGEGITKILRGNITGIRDVINGLTSYVNVFRNIRNKKYDKEIERQQKVVKSLEQEYKNLGRAMEDSLGSDYMKNAEKQSENLKKQAEAIGKQIEAEKKKGKDSDKKKIEELEQQRQDLLLQSVQVVEDAIERLAGTDLTSAAEDFASAWLDAYVSFGNTTEAMQERFKDMMQNMVINAALSKIMEKALSPVFDMIEAAWGTDSMLTQKEIAYIASMSAKAIETGNTLATEYMDTLKKLGVDLTDIEKETNLTGISKGIAGITEDTALVLGGYLDSIRFKLFQYIDYMMLPENRPAMALLIQGQNMAIAHLQAIELNTRSTAESNSAILKKFDDIVISSETGKGWALNVNA